jgi:hypothetical protein
MHTDKKLNLSRKHEIIEIIIYVNLSKSVALMTTVSVPDPEWVAET